MLELQLGPVSWASSQLSTLCALGCIVGPGPRGVTEGRSPARGFRPEGWKPTQEVCSHGRVRAQQARAVGESEREEAWGEG